MAKDINDFIEENMRYVKLEDGGIFDGYYVGHKIVPNKFKKGDDGKAETIEYAFQTLKGKTVNWTNGTMNVATKFHGAQPGERVRLIRNGMGNKTNYTVLIGTKLGPSIQIEKKHMVNDPIQDAQEPNDSEVPF